MQININAVRFKTDKELEKFITNKIEKVGKFHENVIGSDVTLKLENTEKPENKIAEIRLKIKGNDLISSKQCKTFEEATDLAIEALHRQLKKIKDKKINKTESRKKIEKITNISDTEDVEDIIYDIE
jgi:putative sigma-54 modulation protein